MFGQCVRSISSSDCSSLPVLIGELIGHHSPHKNFSKSATHRVNVHRYQG
jgi:hypothetical protein